MIGLSRDVQERLLGRAISGVLTAGDREALAGKRLLVTGAGGSIGGELARQLAACDPSVLVLFDHAEYNLFRIDAELRESWPQVPVEPVLGDVSRRSDIATACRGWRPHAVFHAAAYKHVTLAERSLVAAARTNVIGTAETLRAAREVGARFVLISTDKAAEPHSVMGATKRFAELVALTQADASFRPIAVRFGNILGSSGSVVEIMLRCIRDGRPLPITQPDATRFFMTAEEAVWLVLKADLIGRGGDVYWLDMGSPVRIGDLAERVMDWATPAGARRVGIDVIGLRPGEKMREELTAQGLAMMPTSHERIWSARQRDVLGTTVRNALTRLRRACATGDAFAAINALMSVVDDFEPSPHAVAAARAASLNAAAPVLESRAARAPVEASAYRSHGARGATPPW